MNVKLLTFKTNHTIMAEVVSDTATTITLKQPVQVVMQPTKEGAALAFGPFLEFAQEFKTGIEIAKSEFLCITTPIRDLENQYNQIFGSGIQLVSSLKPNS